MGRASTCRLVAIDLDGTLLDSKHELPERNRVALHRAHEAGIRVVLCTGRSFTETRPILDQIGLDLDATVTVGGALISDARTARTLERTPLAQELACKAGAWFQRRGYAVLWLVDRDQAGFDGYDIQGPNRHPAYDRWIEKSPCEMKPIAGLPDGAAEPLRVTIVDDTGVLEAMSAEFEAAFDGRLTHNIIDVPAYGFTVIESFAVQVNKWYGIERLCQRWAVDPRRTVAIGDDVNDIAMIHNAGLGVAVANARANVKTAAKRVVADNDSCGVADLIDELLSS